MFSQQKSIWIKSAFKKETQILNQYWDRENLVTEEYNDIF